MSTKQATVVTLCQACNDHVWQDQFDPNDEIRDGFQDVDDVLWTERDDDTYYWDIQCSICEGQIYKGWVKYVGAVVFR